MSGETPNHEGEDFVAPDEVTTQASPEVTENISGIENEHQETLQKIEGVISIWKDNIENAAVMSPFEGRLKEYQRSMVPELEDLANKLRNGESTYEHWDPPYKKQRSIAERFEEIADGWRKLS